MLRVRQRALATPVGTYLSWLMIVGMVWIVPVELLKGNWPVATLALLAVGVSLLPAFLRRNYRIVLPWELEFLILLQLYLHTFWGVWLRWYDAHWFWDKLLHWKGTMLVSFLGFLCAYALHASGRLRLSGPFLGLFTVIFGNALGAWWEIAEFGVDKLLGKNTQYGLNNTMWDIINNLGGCLLAAGLGWLYVRYTHPMERRQLMKPLSNLLGRLLVREMPERRHSQSQAR